MSAGAPNKVRSRTALASVRVGGEAGPVPSPSLHPWETLDNELDDTILEILVPVLSGHAPASDLSRFPSLASLSPC